MHGELVGITWEAIVAYFSIRLERLKKHLKYINIIFIMAEIRTGQVIGLWHIAVDTASFQLDSCCVLPAGQCGGAAHSNWLRGVLLEPTRYRATPQGRGRKLKAKTYTQNCNNWHTSQPGQETEENHGTCSVTKSGTSHSQIKGL
jgi:hypothetical protein